MKLRSQKWADQKVLKELKRERKKVNKDAEKNLKENAKILI